jgi:hypothetical protein
MNNIRMTKSECRMTKDTISFEVGRVTPVRAVSQVGEHVPPPGVGRLRPIALRAAPAYGAMRSVSVSVWKAV